MPHKSNSNVISAALTFATTRDKISDEAVNETIETSGGTT